MSDLNENLKEAGGKYSLSRTETAVIISGISSRTFSNNSSAKAAGLYLVTGDYYFSDNNTPLFVGAGAGIFSTAGVSLASGNSNVGTGSRLAE